MTRPSFFNPSSTPRPFHTLPPVRESIVRDTRIRRNAEAFERLGAELRQLEVVRMACDAGHDEGYRAGYDEGYGDGREGMVWAVVTGAVAGAAVVAALGWITTSVAHLLARLVA